MRRFRLGRESVVAAMLCILLIPAVGSIADPDEQLERTEDKLAKVRSELEFSQDRAGSVRDQVHVIERDMNRLQIAIAELDGEIAKVEAKVRDAEAQIAETQKQIDAVEDRAIEQAVTLYESGGVDVLGALLESQSLAELDARAQMLGIAARENTGALIEYGRLKVRIEFQSRELLAHKKLLTGQRASRAELYALQSERKNKLDSLYAELNQTIAKLKDQEGDLEADANALREKIIAAQSPAAANVASLGTSASGFIWPLNGPVTSPYGPRWGRMHTGIDIDGSTGQPIVATKVGRVILSGYYGGYGNAVILDHGGGLATLYGHMSSFAVSSGQTVSQGQVVGAVGCTGSCTGDHLHFEVRINGSPVNPLGYLP